MAHVDKVALRELELFIDNDSALYRQRFMPILANQCKKKKAGRWNQKLAVKGWMYLVDDGAKKYKKEFGDSDTVGSGAWHKMFNTATRRALAARYAKHTATQCVEHGLAGVRARAAARRRRRGR